MKTPLDIVHHMLNNDAYSRWLGIEVLEVFEGKCVLKLQVNESMLNGFYISHGGITYALSDSALAFAANSYGQKCVSIETSISHLRPTKNGDILTATAIEKHRGKTNGIYEVVVVNQEEKLVSLFKGIVSISQETW